MGEQVCSRVLAVVVLAAEIAKTCIMMIKYNLLEDYFMAFVYSIYVARFLMMREMHALLPFRVTKTVETSLPARSTTRRARTKGRRLCHISMGSSRFL